MPDQLPDHPDEGHPIVAGLVALVGVGLAVGLILGFVVLAGTRVIGLDEDGASSDSGSEPSLYIPAPAKTPTASGPQITLAPDGSTPTRTPGDKPTKKKSPQKRITLSASATNVSPMEQVDLTGVYPGGEGAILQIQRFTDGAWQDFPVTASVSNETFSTYVQTSQPGVNRFRVVDTDTGLESNDVRVTIG